jgi:hypothetical protein
VKGFQKIEILVTGYGEGILIPTENVECLFASQFFENIVTKTCRDLLLFLGDLEVRVFRGTDHESVNVGDVLGHRSIFRKPVGLGDGVFFLSFSTRDKEGEGDQAKEGEVVIFHAQSFQSFQVFQVRQPTLAKQMIAVMIQIPGPNLGLLMILGKKT